MFSAPSKKPRRASLVARACCAIAALGVVYMRGGMHVCPSHGRRAMASLVFQSGKNLNAGFERLLRTEKKKKKALLRSVWEATVLFANA